MKQLIASCLKVDRSVRNVFEWHVWMDGGCSGNQLGQYAIQFVACLKEEVERCGGDDKEWVESGQKMETPYGQRLEWLMPNGTPFALHLKDPSLVKRGKRWSQVMYMYVSRFPLSPTLMLLFMQHSLMPAVRPGITVVLCVICFLLRSFGLSP